MKTKWPLLIVLGFSPFSAHSTEWTTGHIECQVGVLGDCSLAWTMDNVERDVFRVQRFDAASRSWRTEQSDVKSSGVVAPKVPGSLYRVVACGGGDERCVSTPVYWIPVIPKSKQDIPDVVYGARDQVMLVNSDRPLRTGIIQYNVYLFVRDFEAVDLSKLPEMVSAPSLPKSTVDIVHDNIFSNYEGYRNARLGRPMDPGPQPPEAQNLHPEGHGEHVHETQ